MNENIDDIRKLALDLIAAADDAGSLNDARVAVLGKKGSLTQAGSLIKDIPNDQKSEFGKALNAARTSIQSAIDEKQTQIQDASDVIALAGIDPTLPSRKLHHGSLHPLTLIRDEAIQVFRRMGFSLADGPEIEDEYHCFDALNTPADHPARNEKDTFYFDSGLLLRTHTSSVQIRIWRRKLHRSVSSLRDLPTAGMKLTRHTSQSSTS